MKTLIWDNGRPHSDHSVWFVRADAAEMDLLTQLCAAYRTGSADYGAKTSYVLGYGDLRVTEQGATCSAYDLVEYVTGYAIDVEDQEWVPPALLPWVRRHYRSAGLALPLDHPWKEGESPEEIHD